MLCEAETSKAIASYRTGKRDSENTDLYGGTFASG
ncbi:hypothetical protein ABIF68_006789 [Bradyrhizobium japonicum]